MRGRQFTSNAPVSPPPPRLSFGNRVPGYSWCANAERTWADTGRLGRTGGSGLGARSIPRLTAVLAAGLASAAFQNAPPPVLEAETSGTLTLPDRTDHWLYIAGNRGSFTIVDTDEGKVLGTIHGGRAPVLALSPDDEEYYVSESYWAKENRGERFDMVTVYDARTLELTEEIELPGRLIASGRIPFFSTSADGSLGYVFNLEPASSVQVVDLDGKRFLNTVEIPGCGLIFPFGNDGFASLCADGALATVMLDDAGAGSMVTSAPFFDAENDPVFEESPVDRRTGEALFITYSGQVNPVMLGAEPQFAEPWSIQRAAGLSAAEADVEQETWRPGGRRPFAVHRDSGMLFVLMHTGTHWTQKEHGIEVWAIDTHTKDLKGRFDLPTSGRAIAVSQDDDPLLYVSGDGGWLWIMDPDTGKIVRQMPEMGRAGMMLVPGF